MSKQFYDYFAYDDGDIFQDHFPRNLLPVLVHERGQKIGPPDHHAHGLIVNAGPANSDAFPKRESNIPAINFPARPPLVNQIKCFASGIPIFLNM